MEDLPDDMVRAFLEGRALRDVLAFEYVSKASKAAIARFFPLLFGRHIWANLDRQRAPSSSSSSPRPVIRELLQHGTPRQKDGQSDEEYKLLLATYYRSVVHELALAMADVVVTRIDEHAAYAKYNHFGSSSLRVVGPAGEDLLLITIPRKASSLPTLTLTPAARVGRRRRHDWRYIVDKLIQTPELQVDARTWAKLFAGLLLDVSPLIALKMTDYAGKARTVSLRTNGDLV